jgi:uroporphyrinogen decarboxylase
MVPGVDTPRITQFLKAATLAAAKIKDRPVFGGCIGPFSLAGRLFGMTDIMTAVFLEPETISILAGKCTTFLSSYIHELKNTGINGIIMAEPAAGLLDESLCNNFSSKFIKTLVDTFQDEKFMVILHNCGNTGHVTRSMISTGARGLHFGNRVDMKEVLTEVPSNIIVFGNLDPVGVFKSSTPAQVAGETRKLLELTRDFPNFVLSSGCDIPPGVSLDNINAFYDTLKEYNENLRQQPSQIV